MLAKSAHEAIFGRRAAGAHDQRPSTLGETNWVKRFSVRAVCRSPLRAACAL